MRETDLLDRYLDEERQKPFTWGRGNGDCMLFLLGWWERATGRPSPFQWRDLYSDEAGARHALNAYGGSVAAVCDIVGTPRMGSEAVRGDMGLLEHEGWHLGMICTGSMWAFRDGRRGIRMTRRQPDIAWPLDFS